jgi:uracil phosphoribosyltransferase
VQAIDVVKAAGAKEIVFVCIVASPEGVATLQKAHPEVSIHTGALDRGLNAKKYILPGLGDFGDRLYGT